MHEFLMLRMLQTTNTIHKAVPYGSLNGYGLVKVTKFPSGSQIMCRGSKAVVSQIWDRCIDIWREQILQNHMQGIGIFNDIQIFFLHRLFFY